MHGADSSTWQSRDQCKVKEAGGLAVSLCAWHTHSLPCVTNTPALFLSTLPPLLSMDGRYIDMPCSCFLPLLQLTLQLSLRFPPPTSRVMASWWRPYGLSWLPRRSGTGRSWRHSGSGCSGERADARDAGRGCSAESAVLRLRARSVSEQVALCGYRCSCGVGRAEVPACQLL